jgi:hypothetical protein
MFFFPLCNTKSSKCPFIEAHHTYHPFYPSKSRLPPIIPLTPLNPSCPLGFSAPHGLTTAERRNKYFSLNYNKSHECLWDGPTWPYATAITLTAVAKVLSDPRLRPILQPPSISAEKLSHDPTLTEIPQKPSITKEDYFNMLMTYAMSHRRTREKGEKGWTEVENGENEKEKNTICWLDENLDPVTGADSEILFLCFILFLFRLYFSSFISFIFFIFIVSSSLCFFDYLFLHKSICLYLYSIISIFFILILN